MAKPKSVYTCTECGGQSTKWQGQCAHCNAWNTLVETALEAGAGKAGMHRFASLAGTSEIVSPGCSSWMAMSSDASVIVGFTPSASAVRSSNGVAP